MPQDRTLLQQTATFRVERVLLHSPSLQWSASYEVASPRLVLPSSGSTEFRMAGRDLLLDGLTAVSLPTGLPYQMKPLAGAARASIVVSAQPGAASDVVDAPPACAAWSLAPHALWLLRRHWRALARGDERQEPTQAMLQRLLSHSTPAAQGQGQGQGRPAAVQRAQHFMAERTADTHAARWTLNDVADAACCSLFHLARSFRKHTGLSLHGYRQRLRLAAALQRLEEGERDIAALAHELGYSSQSHLGSAFMREIGVTPASARRVLTV
nr:helix-turn-helix transcriptional regulator [Rhodoferax sp.]